MEQTLIIIEKKHKGDKTGEACKSTRYAGC
jgi:hypothetical protein